MTAMMKLNLEWKILDSNQVALIFDKTSWLAFQMTADSRGVDTSGSPNKLKLVL